MSVFLCPDNTALMAQLIKDSSEVIIAVQYWGKNSAEEFGLNKSDPSKITIICDLMSSDTSGIRRLKAANSKIKSFNQMHGKVLWTPHKAYLGCGSACNGGEQIAKFDIGFVCSRQTDVRGIKAWLDSIVVKALDVSETYIDDVERSLAKRVNGDVSIHGPFVDRSLAVEKSDIVLPANGVSNFRPPVPGGLARWQERRAKELLSANLVGGISLVALANEFRVSVSHFSKAFRRSTGIPPHQWLLLQRVEAAKTMLRQRRHLTLSEIALACGFADQSHFTRVFSRTVGVSPGAWLRCIED